MASTASTPACCPTTVACLALSPVSITVRFTPNLCSRLINTGTRLAGNTITGLALRQAPDGTPELWVTAGKARYDGTITDYVEGGVSRLNLRTWVWDLTLRSRDEPELSDANLGSVAIGDDRRVWMGTGTGLRKLGANPNSGRGVLVYDPETGVWETLRQQGSRDDALAGNTVPAIAARGALLWLATSYSDAFSTDQSREGGGVTMKDAAGLVSWRGGQGGFRAGKLEELIRRK